MTDLVDSGRIEHIVGDVRQDYLHLGRAVSSESTVYILHSQQCIDTTPDLRKCAYSLALDKGIELEDWQGFIDCTVTLTIAKGRLFPGWW